MLRAIVPAAISELGPLEVEIRMMTGALARDGHVVEPSGVVLDGYQKNPIQLWQHDPNCPVARNEDLRLDGGSIVARCTFAPAGISAKADEIRGLVKAGIINAVSIGFDVLEAEPLDPKRPKGGQHITRWELLECSFVSVPADAGALVVARDQGARELTRDASSTGGEDWKCGAARDLPIADGDPAWDGPAAQASIFEWAGGPDGANGDFSPEKAKQGFLAYDAGSPQLRGSYKLPFARVTGGKLEVPKSALRAASGAHGVGAAEIGGAKAEAQEVLDHYKTKAGIGETKETKEAPRAAQAALTRHVARTLAAPAVRGMYDVACLAMLLADLAYQKDSAAWEAAAEGDDSKVPAMLLAVLKELGQAFLAMGEEEVGELLDNDGVDDMPPMFGFLAGKPALTRMLRAGARLSAAAKGKLEEADGHLARALDHHADAGEAEDSIGERAKGIADAHAKAVKDHGAGMAALEAGDADEAARCFARMARNMDAIADHNTGLGDDHDAIRSAHSGVKRCIAMARGVMDEMRAAAEPGVDAGPGGGNSSGPAGNSKQIQTSAGIGESGGSENGRGSFYAQRQADKARLGAA